MLKKEHVLTLHLAMFHRHVSYVIVILPIVSNSTIVSTIVLFKY